MEDFLINNTTPLLALLTVFLNIVTVVLLYALFSKDSYAKRISAFAGQRALLFGFVVALGSALGSLTYSNIVGFDPCVLCWWSRIFLYPLTIIFGVGLYVKEKSVWLYAAIFSGLALIVSTYQIYIQKFGITDGGFCTDGGCSRIYVDEFGYITIPGMAFSVAIV